jgi:hypothetical protein
MLTKILTGALIALLILLAVAPATQAQPQLAITVSPEKRHYHYRQLVSVYGNVTYLGELVDEGLVAIQITFPHSLQGFNATRTVPANATPADDWQVETISIMTTNSEGDPQTSFTKGGDAWFKVTLRNNLAFVNRTVLYVLSLYDSDSTPFKVHWARVTILPESTFTELVRLDLNGYDGGNWVSTGTAHAYANVYTDWPSMGGSPYCPEQSAAFTIVATGTQVTGLTTPTETAAGITTLSSYNSYQAAVRLPPNIPIGTYNVTASAYYNGIRDTYTSTTFARDYEMPGDIIFNRKVDIFDVVAVASAYGTQGGAPTWNPEADLDANGKVNIFDVVIIAGNYGKTY